MGVPRRVLGYPEYLVVFGIFVFSRIIGALGDKV